MESGGTNLTSINSPVFVRALSKSTDGNITLKTGDVIQARVIAFTQGSAVLNIGGLRMPVSTGLILNPGDSISLMVVEMRPDRVVLKRLDESSPGRPMVRHIKDELLSYLLKNAGLEGIDIPDVTDVLKGDRVDIGRSLAEIAKHLTALEKGGEDAVRFSRLLASLEGVVVNSGDGKEIESAIKAMARAVSYEAGLLRYLEGNTIDAESLKERLLESRLTLQNHLQTAPNGLLSSLKTAIEKVLTLLNSIEVFNIPADSQARDIIYLPLPIRFGDDMRTADIRIYTKGTGSGRGLKFSSTFTIAFALDMPSLGKTRALLETVGKFVNFSISFENRAGLTAVEGLLGELKESLEGLGYMVGSISATEFKDEGIGKSLIEEKIGIKPEGIDIKA